MILYSLKYIIQIFQKNKQVSKNPKTFQKNNFCKTLSKSLPKFLNLLKLVLIFVIFFKQLFTRLLMGLVSKACSFFLMVAFSILSLLAHQNQ